jgi:hypothetical protein
MLIWKLAQASTARTFPESVRSSELSDRSVVCIPGRGLADRAGRLHRWVDAAVVSHGGLTLLCLGKGPSLGLRLVKDAGERVGGVGTPRSRSAAVRASGPGGMRSLRRWGRPGGADAIAICSSAVT